jgi:threonyl-tRNA synthetase editing subunit
MKLLCFQAKSFRWKTHAKTLPEVPDQDVEEEVAETLVAFIHAEASDENAERRISVLRQTLKHMKWLANKRGLKNIVIHSFAHLGGETASPAGAESIIVALSERLRETGYQAWITPFGYFCEWDLDVYGESLAKVWKEIR